jgi:predicted dehydrogenase
MNKINLCFLGCGKIARLHSRFARRFKPDINLIYASRSLEKAKQYQRKYHGIAAFGSYEEACGSSLVDAVFICTPHACHLENIQLAAAHQKHVLVEKPIARNIFEIDQIKKIVQQANIKCMVAENYYFKPSLKVLKEYLKKEYIGKPLFIEVNRVNLQENTGWRTNARMMGGGALLEGGVHWINMISQLGGGVKEVLAVQPHTNYAMKAPFEDSLQVLLRFENGAVGKLLHSWNITTRLRGIQFSRIYGTEGTILFESNGLIILLAGKKTKICLPNISDFPGYKAMLREFISCLKEDRDPAMSIEIARRDMQVILAAYRSLKTGQFEKPETVNSTSFLLQYS